MEALRYKNVDRQYWAHLSAFLNFSVRAEKGKGKNRRPVYREFSQFFDYQKELDKCKYPNKEKTMISRIKEFYRKEAKK